MGPCQVNFVRGLLQKSPLATGLQKSNGSVGKETTRECTVVFIPNLSKFNLISAGLNSISLERFAWGCLGCFFWNWQLKVGAML